LVFLGSTKNLSASVTQLEVTEQFSRVQIFLNSFMGHALTSQKCLDTIGKSVIPTNLLTVPLLESFEEIKKTCLQNEKQ
jgi:hypothetical protein